MSIGGSCTWTQKEGACLVATVARNSVLYWESPGTLGTANVAGSLDCDGDRRTKDITNLNMFRGGYFGDRHKIATPTNDIVLAEGCALSAT